MYHDEFGCKRDTQVRGGLKTAKNAGSNIKIGVELRFHCPLSKTALQARFGALEGDIHLNAQHTT